MLADCHRGSLARSAYELTQCAVMIPYLDRVVLCLTLFEYSHIKSPVLNLIHENTLRPNKTHYQAQIARLEDYAVRGSNYMEFSDYIHPTKSNIRILSQNTKGLPPKDVEYRNIPTGRNYGFHNTPSMRMP